MLTPQLYDKIKHFARFPQTGVSLRQMVMFGQKPSLGTLYKASQFLHEELPIRLAHRVKELEELPKNLSQMNSIVKVKNWYAESFQDLINLKSPKLPTSLKEKLYAKKTNILPQNVPNPSLSKLLVNNASKLYPSVPIQHRYFHNVEQMGHSPEIIAYNEELVKTIDKIHKRHSPVVTTMAQGILEYKEYINAPLIDAQVQQFLDRFYLSRIGIRMLIGQHTALYRGPYRKNYVGVIDSKTNIKAVAMEAIQNAQFICEEHYGMYKAPSIQMICPGDIEFMYVPSHLIHVLFEILKNSLRAVVERYGSDYEDTYPPIKVVISHGKEDVTIKISDEGGGIPRSSIPLVWTYMYTTARTQEFQPELTDYKAPMAGFGYGLPMSRLYARYFGGDLSLVSMEGHGTDVYFHLNRLSNSDEPLIYTNQDDFSMNDEPQELLEARS